MSVAASQKDAFAPFSPSSGEANESAARIAEGDRDRLRKLDGLLELTPADLEALYREARAPRLGDVAGDLRGRMLAWPAFDTRPRVKAAVRAFAGSRAFPWRGKTFKPFGEISGEGINRVFSDKLRLFRFETSIAPSRAGDFDALQLDYDLPTNPPGIRSIKDEIREVERGLWLGQAYWQGKAGHTLVLFFALARVYGE